MCTQDMHTIPEGLSPGEAYLYHPDTAGLRYLALGDSYTKAEGENYSNSYPSLLVQKLREYGFPVKTQLTIAQTGWRTDQLKNALDKAALKDTFDLVSLLIGVNNQYQGKSPEAYQAEFRELLETSIVLANKRVDKVFVLSIPDYGVTPFGSAQEAHISSEIALFNSLNKEVSDALGVHYFDITPLSRQAKKDPELLCPDNLHPSGKMYTLWAELIIETLKTIAAKP